MNNPKVEVGYKEGFGKALYAKANISKDEIIAIFDGPEFEAENTSHLPKDIADHAIQFAPNKWKDSIGIARYINHSCEPNCGIRGLFDLVSM